MPRSILTAAKLGWVCRTEAEASFAFRVAREARLGGRRGRGVRATHSAHRGYREIGINATALTTGFPAEP